MASPEAATGADFKMSLAAILIPCLCTGGTEVATLETAQALHAQGWAVDVMVYFDEVDATMRQSFTSNGLRVQCLGLARAGGFRGALRLLWALRRSLRKGHYDLIWVQYMTPTLIPLLVARLSSRRLVAAVHVAAGHYGPGGLKRLRWLARWWCDRFVCVSQTSARGIFGDALDDKAFRQRVRVLPNAIDMAAVESAQARGWRGELDLPLDAVVIGYVGRLAYNKGPDILLRAAALLASDHPALRFVIVGDGATRPELEALMTELGLSGVVHFVGALPRDAVYAAIMGFDITVVPSREEGFGLTALEAMACGVPLVASRVDALEEVVVDGRTGLLFDAENEEDLASKLKIMLNDQGLRVGLSDAGFKNAYERFSRDTCWAQVKQFMGEFA